MAVVARPAPGGQAALHKTQGGYEGVSPRFLVFLIPDSTEIKGKTINVDTHEIKRDDSIGYALNRSSKDIS